MPTIRIPQSRIQGPQQRPQLPDAAPGLAPRSRAQVAQQAAAPVVRFLDENSDRLKRQRAEEDKSQIDEAASLIDSGLRTAIAEQKAKDDLLFGSAEDYADRAREFDVQANKVWDKATESLPPHLMEKVNQAKEATFESAYSAFESEGFTKRQRGTQRRQALAFGELIEGAVEATDFARLLQLRNQSDDKLSSLPEDQRQAATDEAFAIGVSQILSKLEEEDGDELTAVQEILLGDNLTASAVNRRVNMIRRARSALDELQESLPEELRTKVPGRGTKIEPVQGGISDEELEALSGLLESLPPSARIKLKDRAQEDVDRQVSDAMAELDVYFVDNPEATVTDVMKHLYTKTRIGTTGIFTHASSAMRGGYARRLLDITNRAKQRDQDRRATSAAAVTGRWGTAPYERQLMANYEPAIIAGFAKDPESEEYRLAVMATQKMIGLNGNQAPKELATKLGDLSTILPEDAGRIFTTYRFLRDVRTGSLFGLKNLGLPEDARAIFYELDEIGGDNLTIEQAATHLQRRAKLTQEDRERMLLAFKERPDADDLFDNVGEAELYIPPENLGLRTRYENAVRQIFSVNGGYLNAAKMEAAANLRLGEWEDEVMQDAPSEMGLRIPKDAMMQDARNTFIQYRKQMVDPFNTLIGEELELDDVTPVPAWVNGKVIYRFMRKSDSQMLLIRNDDGQVTTLQWEPQFAIPRNEALRLRRLYSDLFDAANGAQSHSGHDDPRHLEFYEYESDYLRNHMTPAARKEMGRRYQEARKLLGDYISGDDLSVTQDKLDAILWPGRRDKAEQDKFIQSVMEAGRNASSRR